MTSQRLDRRDFYSAGTIFLIAASVYLCFSSKNYVFEGLARAMPIELGRFAALFNGNYLLYGFLGSVFHSLLGFLGHAGLAVRSLQILDALLGGAGAALFFIILRQLRAERVSAILWAAVLGTSFGYWRWSTDAEDYILSTFLLEINFYFLISYLKGKGSPIRLGALHALAILGHIVNCVFVLVSLWLIVSRHRRSSSKPVLAYLTTCIAMITAAYAAVLFFIVQPANVVGAWHWFLGSANTAGGGVGFHTTSQPWGLWQWIRMTGHIFTSFQPEFISPAGWKFSGIALWVARGCLIAFAGTVVFGSRRIVGENKIVAIGCCLWLLAYAAVFTSWEPFTMVYRVSDLVPLCALLFLGHQQAIQKSGRVSDRWKAALLALAVSLGLGNFGAEIYPSSFESNNPDLLRMRFIKANTSEGDWVAGEGGRDELYIPYFAERRPLLIGRFRDDPLGLVERVNGLLGARQEVFVTSRVFQDAYWNQFFKRFDPKEMGVDSTGFALYRLTAPYSPPTKHR